MSKRFKLISLVIIGFALVLGVYFITIASKDDVTEIKKIVHAFNQPMTEIAHIEFLDNNQAIAFYEWGPKDEVYFGALALKKGLFGWESLGGGTGQISSDYKLNWGFSNLEMMGLPDYTDLIRGKILAPEIVEVKIMTKKEKEYEANIIEYNTNDRFWFLITDGEDTLGSTITGLSEDGEIIEQITF